MDFVQQQHKTLFANKLSKRKDEIKVGQKNKKSSRCAKLNVYVFLKTIENNCKIVKK